MDILKSTAEDDENVFEWVITTPYSGERIDKVATALLQDQVSRTQVQQWIKEANLTVNHQRVKANHLVQENDLLVVTIPPSQLIDAEPEAMDLDVYYEDQDVIVINKPRGLVVHPAPGHYRGTLVHGLLHHCKDLSGIQGVKRPGIVHRIDKDTSGLLVVAKHDRAHQHLADQFKKHTVIRKYQAIVHGNVAHDEGSIDAPIGRDLRDRKMYTVIERNSKQAVTHFRVIERLESYTFLELRLETGRTHQIRVHLKFVGYPLVGDPLYGRSKSKGMDISGQALHAAILGFEHPINGRHLLFEAPLPNDMKQFIERIRQ